MPGRAIRVRGIVQGVGFRPTIWRLARQHRLTGEVWNDGLGVMIHAFGSDEDLEAFIEQIPLQLPPLARLDSLEAQSLDEQLRSDEFRIVASRHNGVETPVAADAATCADCLADIAAPGNRRYRYPFTNCTHCGPRLSIIRKVPYDRCHTSMAEFAMCSQCQREYDNPADRRFHAQANCCPDCGPKLWLEDRHRVQLDCADPLKHAAELIRQGYIIAIKGLGGFHLACNATDADAVNRLRERKRRYAKPLALMADAITITRYALMDEEETRALHDKAAPIVLLTAQGETLAPGVAPDDDKLGFMLPYTPLHTLLLQELDEPIVLTSGNISDEPQCTDNDEAREKLTGIADYLLLHDRAIVNRLDDSVARLMDGKIRVLRRARGYSPEALLLPPGFEQTDSILAMGAELKNSFCLLKNGQAVVSQHIGDLENAAVQRDYRNAIDLYKNLYGFKPQCTAVDNHPGYLSTQYGQTLAETDAAVLAPVQHHHAHLAACLAEHGVALNAPPVLAAIFDGLGLGDDGALWGGEFLLGDYRGYTRLGHFQPIALPGGTQAMREPWRNTYAQFSYYFDWETLQRDFADLDIIKFLASKPLAMLTTMISKNLNSPPSTSCGRWFDAFAATLGLHSEQVHYEGQAAIALEILATPLFADEQAYPQAWAIDRSGELSVLSWQGLWLAVLADLKRGADKARIAARIHHSLIAATVELLSELSRQTGIDRIVLSGGVFQNRLLLEGVSGELRRYGKTVLSPQRYPMNDGGLALGQAVIAAARSI
ncbi:carbamoyltransferase HypF [Methylobacter tundripaludum]|uniref:Carbamoyltransferase HypF n=1 Tax=Methylobacter tundripaludum (strain ATCC BAA-1195 / DSM 17260 / SV96) TaxID=697282 RepID=G3J196_METTV|nr:carbamoyltransferase HypF [Methylobacter tundripaludum]EGW20968.1 (NiFe) hydrogenase maturation protein HypF [Methylobacter tundripaludum SV96]